MEPEVVLRKKKKVRRPSSPTIQLVGESVDAVPPVGRLARLVNLVSNVVLGLPTRGVYIVKKNPTWAFCLIVVLAVLSAVLGCKRPAPAIGPATNVTVTANRIQGETAGGTEFSLDLPAEVTVEYTNDRQLREAMAQAAQAEAMAELQRLQIAAQQTAYEKWAAAATAAREQANAQADALVDKATQQVKAEHEKLRAELQKFREQKIVPVINPGT